MTNLFNHTMSFIRYSLGDRGSLLGEKVCPSCGFLGPSLALVAGRLEDYYLLPDGRKLSPRVIDSLMMVSAFPTSGGEGYYAKQYQCIQETRGMIRVLMIPADHAPNDLAARISRAIESIGPGITCRVEYVDAFPSSLSGKHRSIVSRVRV